MRDETYRMLMAGSGESDVFDSHIFACIIAARCQELDGAMHELLGLGRDEFAGLLNRFFPAIAQEWAGRGCFKVFVHARLHEPFACHCCGTRVMEDGNSFTDPIIPTTKPMYRDEVTAEEEQDICRMLLEHRAVGDPVEAWIAAAIARSALRPNHLWEDLGLHERAEVTRTMHLHFPTLAARNAGNRMRWKKFFYKQLCDRADVPICRAPNCEVCDEYTECFGPEETAAEFGDKPTQWVMAVR